MRKHLLTLGLLLTAYHVQSQTTFTFQPDACSGRDAIVLMKNGLPETANTNFGTQDEICASGWTFSGQGGGTGFSRIFIDFDGLKNIPQGTTITGATLSLYGRTSAGPFYSGNTAPNASWIQRVTGGAWDETTITWNTQPAVTTTNQTAIPASTSQYGYNVAINVTQLVQDIVNQPVASRYGFCIRLQTETYYRNLDFASSEYSTAALRPKLEVQFNTCVSGRVGNIAASYNNQPDALPVNKKAGTGPEFTIYPNPAGEDTKVTFVSAIAGPVVVELLNQEGNVIQTKKINASKGTNTVPFNLDANLRGMHYFSLKSAEGITTKGLMIQK